MTAKAQLLSNGTLKLPNPDPKHGHVPPGDRREVQIVDLCDLQWWRGLGPDAQLNGAGKVHQFEEKACSAPNTTFGSATDLTSTMLYRFRRSYWLCPRFSSSGSDILVEFHVGTPMALEEYFHKWENLIYNLTRDLNSMRDGYKHALMQLKNYTESAAEKESQETAERLKRGTQLHYPGFGIKHVRQHFQKIDLAGNTPKQIRDFVTANPIKPKRAKRKSLLELSLFDGDDMRPTKTRNRNGHKHMRASNCRIFAQFF